MSSKGIDFYGYVTDGFSFEIRKKDAGKDEAVSHMNPQSHWQLGHYEIEGSLFGDSDGYFQFIAKKGNRILFERKLRVNGRSGSINPEDIKNMLIPSIFDGEYCLSFGLYDSDAGILSDLPKSHQIYACLTDNHMNWQKRLFNNYQHKKHTLNDVFLKNMFLPGSHDAGMYLDTLGNEVSNFANTQKESITHQLKLGARYFDFRPGILKEVQKESWSQNAHSVMKLIAKNVDSVVKNLALYVGELRHIHTLIPGETYEDFLKQVITFLNDNQQEIVVVKIKNDGFIDSLVRTPVKTQLEAILNQLLHGHRLQTGNASSFNKSIEELLKNNERLIIIYREDPEREYSTYNDDYGSCDSDVIIKSLDAMNKADVSKSAYIDVQLQLTATSAFSGIVKSVLGDTSYASSPLKGTKSKTDYKSYKWLAEKLNFHNNEKLFVACNDFYDNALTDVAYKINKKKLGLK